MWGVCKINVDCDWWYHMWETPGGIPAYAGKPVGFAMTAVPPEFSVLWAGPKQSKEDGQAAAVMPATRRQGLLSLLCPRCSQLPNGSDSKYWFWAAQLKLLLLACTQALKLVHGWFLKALLQINQYERSCRKIHPSLSQCCKADGCREAVLEKAHGKKMSS